MKFTGERFIPNEQVDQELIIEHFQRYEAIKDIVKGKVVLDAASGEGYGSSILAREAKKVYGLDIDKQAIEEANNKYRKDNLEYRQGSIADMPFEDKSIDIVVSFETIEHVEESLQIEFMKEIKRVLKEDGKLIISTPNKKIYSDEFNYNNEFHIKEFYREEFIEFITMYFNHYKLYSQYKEISYQITCNDNSEIKNIGKYNEEYAKYYICIASSNEIVNFNIESIINEEDKAYITLIHRILSLQEEVEERNKHIKNLDEEIEGRGIRILELQKQVEERNKHIKNLDREIQEQKNIVRDLELNLGENEEMMKETLDEIKKMTQNNNKYINELENKLNLVEENNNELENKLNLVEKNNNEVLQKLETQIQLSNEAKVALDSANNKLANCQQSIIDNKLMQREVLDLKQELERIYESTGWKMLVKSYKVRDKIFPSNSKRRLIMKLSKKAIKNPKLYWNSLSKDNVKKLRYYMKSENVERIADRIDSFDEKHIQIETPSIQTFEVTNDYKKIVFEYAENPIVSIIIPVYNQWEYTYNCLMSIKENTKGICYEIIIADDVSQDETRNILNYIENVKIVRNEKNLGFLLNCNNAVKQARGKYIHFLNNDTNVQENWLTSLVELIESDDSIGMVGSKLVYANGKLQEAGGIIWSDASGWNYGRLDDPNQSEYNYVKEVDYISGASILINKELWKQIGGFDERYVPAYYEDSDLAFEVRKHGYRVMYQPKSVVVHFEGISNGTDISSGHKSYQVINKEKFYDKWKDILEKENCINAENVFKTRDKSLNKKTVLVIDHYVPHYDKDAGSRTVYQYLKLLVKMGFNVKFLGDNFYPHEPYTSELQQMGIEVLYGEKYLKSWKKYIEINGKDFDFIFLNRPHISVKYIDVLKRFTKAKIIYYVCDLHFLREKREYEITKNIDTLKSAQKWEKIEKDIMDKSDIVLTISLDEKNIIENMLGEDKVRVFPVFIFEAMIEHNRNCSITSDLLFVGGFNHKPNLDGVNWFVKEILPQITEKIPDIKFRIVGSNPPQQILDLKNSNIVVEGFVSDERLNEIYKECRLCIIPLRYGAGVKGKTVEGMYSGIPIVATSIGIEGLPDIEKYIKPTDTSEEFANQIINIYHNILELENISNSYKKYVEEHFSIQQGIRIINEVFR